MSPDNKKDVGSPPTPPETTVVFSPFLPGSDNCDGRDPADSGLPGVEVFLDSITFQASPGVLRFRDRWFTTGIGPHFSRFFSDFAIERADVSPDHAAVKAVQNHLTSVHTRATVTFALPLHPTTIIPRNSLLQLFQALKTNTPPPESTFNPSTNRRTLHVLARFSGKLFHATNALLDVIDEILVPGQNDVELPNVDSHVDEEAVEEEEEEEEEEAVEPPPAANVFPGLPTPQFDHLVSQLTANLRDLFSPSIASPAPPSSPTPELTPGFIRMMNRTPPSPRAPGVSPGVSPGPSPFAPIPEHSAMPPAPGHTSPSPMAPGVTFAPVPGGGAPAPGSTTSSGTGSPVGSAPHWSSNQRSGFTYPLGRVPLLAGRGGFPASPVGTT